MRSTHIVFRIAAGLLLGLASANAVEPWADNKLSVTNGLELWFDALHEMSARSKQANSETSNTDQPVTNLPLDLWHDASGHKRTLRQPIPEARPKLFRTASEAFVRFDGINDYLLTAGLNGGLHETTIFILAAPHSNTNGFGAFVALNRDGSNDYSSGLNVDMAEGAKKQFDFVNVEGAGFVGVQNLMTSVVPFGEMHALTILAEPGTNVVDLRIDGVPQERFFHPIFHSGGRLKAGLSDTNAVFGFDQLIVGARFFSNTGDAPHVQRFLHGDISEILIYNRILTEDECRAVESYLKSKLVSRVPGRTLSLLTTVSNAPPVQMFIPGFTVRELPVTLNNINCVKYREDGKLVALGYDGNIWLLSDSDNDGLEDKVTAFWNTNSLRAPIGMALTPPDYSRGRGVFVPSKGKFSLIVDTNRDDIADEEIIVSQGWKESFHGVDALGAAVDKDGSVFFGIGCANFADAYQVDKNTGKSAYDINSVRGTILKMSPDFSRREVVCTGIRFPVAMAFNALGDLFCSDQEGATWLPNGNPFDELLHIQPGRHYGFPPRHPQYLPNVIDEPSVFDYGPQHQSTCGLNFNEPVNGGPSFGPAWWRGDAIVCGESRGKIYRTKLAKTAAGYVAQNQLIAGLNMLTVDACVSPQGDLVVSTHSGKPDWGSGPTGVGKLYKISYTEKEAAVPVAIWPASETETDIQFDRPLDAAAVQTWTKHISATQGKYIAAGDQFESMRPGYQAVQNQLLYPRYNLKVLSTAVSADGRTLIIRTEPRREAINYAFTIPRPPQPTKNKQVVQQPEIDLSCDLTGLAVDWESASARSKNWSGWLPHFDLAAAEQFTKATSVHPNLWRDLSTPGTLKMRTQLDLWEMLRSATQPGSKLDYQYPDETVTVVLKSNGRLDITAPSMTTKRISEGELHLTAKPKKDVWFPISITVRTATTKPVLDVAWFTAEDSRPRALPLRRILMPWATPEKRGGEEQTERKIPEIAGGNWLHGRKLFFGDQLGCFKCHAINDAGGKIGPDLSNLIQRDYASVLKDIVEPSAAINPDHVAYNVELKDGEALTGVLVGSDQTRSKFADATGKITTVEKSQIASIKPSAISLMPEGLLGALSEQQRKDLLTYLLIPSPLEPAPIEAKGEPAPRPRSELDKILRNTKSASKAAQNHLRIVLCSGPKDHGPGEHDYPLWQKRWGKLLTLADNVVVETAADWPTPEQLSKSDVIVFYSNNPGWSGGRSGELDAFLKRGGGLVYLHYAVDGHEHVAELAQRIGLAWRGGASKFRHGIVDLNFKQHPLTADFTDTRFVDESYWNLVGSETNIQLVAQGEEENRQQPLMWTREQGKGRVFVSILGHYTWTFDDPLFRLLILRGIAWSAHNDPNRLSDLADVGARIAP